MRRRLTATFFAVGYLAVTIGLPVPRLAHRPGGEPFPCQQHAGACGCTSAAECWAHCCCFSLDVRLAWAREHGVHPPREIELSGEPVAAAAPAPAGHDSCGTTSPCGTSPQPTADEKPRAGLIIGSMALECGGMLLHWLGTVIAIPPPLGPQGLHESALAERLDLDDGRAVAQRADPLVPPPRS
jgi:hypothetical protein